MKKSIPITLLILTFSLALFGQEIKKENYIYWTNEDEHFDKITTEGETYYLFYTPEFTLAVRGVDGKKTIYAEVYLKNTSTDKSRIEFNPNDSRIIVYAKKSDKTFTELAPLSPEKAADKMDGSSNAKVKNFFDRWRGNMATRTATVNSTTSGTVTMTDSQGMSNGTYQGQTTSTVSVPDADTQNEAEEKIAARNAKVEAKSNSVIQSVLRANTIFAGEDVMGRIYFPYKKGEFMYIAIKIDDKLYIKGFGLSPK